MSSINSLWQAVQEIIAKCHFSKGFATALACMGDCTPENLHAGFCIWVEGRLEAQLRQPQLLEEQVQRANEVAQRHAPVANYTYE
jgi:hypothetical protein